MQFMSVNMTSLQRLGDRVRLFAARRRQPPASSSKPSASAPLRVYRDDVDSGDPREPADKERESVVVTEVDVTITMSVVDEGTEEQVAPEQVVEAPAPPPKELKDMAELRRHLELMHDRCIARNLRSAGLGTFEAVDEEKVYGMLSTSARMADTGESMLWAVVNRVQDVDRQCRYVGILVVEKADVNERNPDSMMTPLMMCCQRGLDKCAKALLHSRQIDHALRDNAGNTALHHMAMHGCEALLKHYFKVLRRLEMKRLSGKDRTRPFETEDVFDVRNKDDQTPYQLAVRSKQLLCAAMLQEEKSKRVKMMNKSLSLVQHIGSPSLSRSMKHGKNLLKRIASFDSLRFDSLRFDNPAVDDLSDEESMLSTSQTDFGLYNVDAKFDADDGDMRPRVVTWHGRKEGKEKKEGNGSPLASPAPLSGPDSLTNMSTNMSVNVGVRVADASRRAQFFQSKAEMMRDAQATSSGAFASSKAMGRSITHTGNLSSSAAKPKLTDRIRNFLRRKPRYGLHGSSSVDNLTAYREESEQYEPAPIGLFGDDIGHIREANNIPQQQRLYLRRKSSSLSKMEAIGAANRLKEHQQQKISVNISASVQLPPQRE